MFEWLRRKKKEVKAPTEPEAQDVTQVGLVGHEMEINPTPTSRERRNRARIATLAQALADLEMRGRIDTDDYRSLRAEYDYRRFQVRMKEGDDRWPGSRMTTT